MGKLVLTTSLTLLCWAWAAADAGAQCFGIRCKTDNTCGDYQSSTSRTCCCQPVCGPGGCESCLQSCLRSCLESCPSCEDCAAAARASAGETFKISTEALRAVQERHPVAGIVLQGRSHGGKQRIYSQLVRGGTNLYGHQVGFTTRITATREHVVLDIVFDEERTEGDVPKDVRVELNAAGDIRVTDLPPGDRKAIEEALALLDLPCELAATLALVRVPI